MELEEIKKQWDQLSSQMDKQKLLTDQMITEMKKERFQRKLKGIALPESIGSLICMGAAVLLIVKFGLLDTWYLQLFGILSIAFCLGLPLITLSAVRRMQQAGKTDWNIRDSLIEFTRARKRFLLVQRMGLIGSMLFAVVGPPALMKVMSGKDMLQGNPILWWYLPLVLILLIPFARWGYRHYDRMTAQAEQLLSDLANE